MSLLVGFGFLCLGATMTAIGVISIQQDLDQKRAELFEHEAHELTRVVEERIEDVAAIMGGLDGLFAAGDVARS
jgi:CHASE1-domain containing sensor protein